MGDTTTDSWIGWQGQSNNHLDERGLLRAAAPKSTVTASKHYAFQLDYVFQPKIFGELQNAQAVVLP